MTLTVNAHQQNVKDHYTPLALLSFLLLIAVFFVIVPLPEWSAVSIYLCVLAVFALFLYQRGIKVADPTFPVAFFLLALFVKFLGSLVRYWTVVDLYDGSADAITYYKQGQHVAQFFKVFDFSILDTYRRGGEGTTWMIHITGLLYTILPTSLAGSFFFFAGLAFGGSVFFYMAVRLAWPEASAQLYALCIFFLPSILFWPSSLGKDAWIFFHSGLVMWGWVSYVRHSRKLGLLSIAVGLLSINLIRPHVAAFLGVSMGSAYLLTIMFQQRSLKNWLIGACAVVILGGYMVQSGADFLKLDSLSVETLQEFYEGQQQHTSSGGSSYETVSVFTPAGAIFGLITALTRPFPWEAHNAQALIASIETMGWLAFCLWNLRKFWHKLRHFYTDPVVTFAFFYSLLMLLALTSLGNFGIIARQRVMMLPFFWMLFV